MKTRATLFVLMCGVLSASMHGAAKTEDQPAIVVSVENHHPQSNSNYAGPLDLPLPPQIYSYDIAIPVGSTRYRTSDASAFDYLPAVFAANHPIQVNLGDHGMYATLPGDRAVRMPIESRSRLYGRSCLWLETGLSDGAGRKTHSRVGAFSDFDRI
jgi:hypothetical protein